MTFVVGNSSQVTGNSLPDQAKTIMNNIQLIHMNQSRIHRLGAGETVNGFVDTFSDQYRVGLNRDRRFLRRFSMLLYACFRHIRLNRNDSN